MVHLDLCQSRIENFDEGCSLKQNMETARKTLLRIDHQNARYSEDRIVYYVQL